MSPLPAARHSIGTAYASIGLPVETQRNPTWASRAILGRLVTKQWPRWPGTAQCEKLEDIVADQSVGLVTDPRVALRTSRAVIQLADGHDHREGEDHRS